MKNYFNDLNLIDFYDIYGMIVKQVLHNSKEYWELVRLRNEVLRKPLNLEFSKEELLSEDRQIHFGIFQNEKALACMVLVAKKEEKMKMRQVCVDPKSQGQKLGQRLLLHCENYAKDNKFRLMQCNARDTAKDFYLSQGYKIKGDLFLEVGIKHFFMEKCITPNEEL
jgi:predicted GNAT family N-acyltransferase